MLTDACPRSPLPIVERADILAGLDELVEDSRARGCMLGLVLVEICQLDEVNQAYGYEAGSALVRAVNDTIEQSKRTTDHVVRVGVDQILLVLPGLGSNGQPILAAQRVLQRCSERFEIAGRHLRPRLRIATAVCPDDGNVAGTLVQSADAAMLQGRRLNRDIVTFAESRIGHQTALLSTQLDLEHALSNGELFCQFQPKIDLASLSLAGVESLTRWQTSGGDLIPPARFIDVAEQNGLITPLTFRALNESLRECAELQETFPGLSVAVNLSPEVFAEPDLREIVLEALQIWRLPEHQLTLEVTESAIMRDLERSAEVLSRFRDAGIGVSIDDFGTGHSSLAYLRELPANELKIDRSFVQTLGSDPQARSLVQTIIELASGLAMHTVAEGVEDIETFNVLREMGCSAAQGFFIARPMGPQALPGWFAEENWAAPLPQVGGGGAAAGAA